MTILLCVGTFVPALFYLFLQLVKKTDKTKHVLAKKVAIFVCINSLLAFIGAICFWSANSHGQLYQHLLLIQNTKNSTMQNVYVEGNVTKIEEKSKDWIYLKNASIRYLTNWENEANRNNEEEIEPQNQFQTERYEKAEGVVVQVPSGTHPLAGSKIGVTGELSLFSRATNPGEFDARSYYHNLGYDFCISTTSWQQIGKNYDPIAEGLWQLKERFKSRLKTLAGEDEADYGIYLAVLLGDKSELDDEQKALFQDQGIAHILSVSGLHISAVGLLFCGLLMKLTGSFAISGTVGSIVVLFYSAFTGNAVSTIRACVMYLILSISRQKGRIYDMPTAAAAAALCLLIFQPLAIFQASMQLSFCAVLGISLVGDIFKRIPTGLSDKEEKIVNSFFSVMGMSIAMFPVLLYHYYQYPLYSQLINQLVIPFSGILIAAPAAALVVSTVSIAVASHLLVISHLVIRFYDILCQVVQILPHSLQNPGRPSAWHIVLYLVLLFIIGFGTRLLVFLRKIKLDKTVDTDKNSTKNKDTTNEEIKIDKRNPEGKQKQQPIDKKRNNLSLIISVLLAFGFYLFGCLFLHADHYKGLEITVLDVGQGDGIFLQLPDQTTILSDCGSTSRSQLDKYVLEPFLGSKGIQHLDYVFVSHADSDHINGILELIESEPYFIGTLMLPQSASAAKQFEKLLSLAEEKQIPIKWLSKGDMFGAKEVSDLSFEVLWPEEEALSEDTNDLSLVWRLSYKDFSMLFTGDLPGEFEGDLNNLEPTTILKVAHHGSNYSTTEEFLRQVQPKLSIISCSATNRYGHPGEQTLERLYQYSANNDTASSVLITKDCGAITIRTNGREVEVETYLSKMSK